MIFLVMGRKKEILNLYNSSAVEYDKWFDRHGELFQKEIAVLREHIFFSTKSLDVGAGTGRFTEALGITKGIDPSEEMVKISIARGVDVILGVAENLPFSSNEFEQVFFITSLCFVEDIEKSIKEASRVLRKDGIITIAFIEKDSLLGDKYRNEKGPWYRNATFFSSHEIEDMVSKEGFELIKTTGDFINTNANRKSLVFDFCVMSFKKK